MDSTTPVHAVKRLALFFDGTWNTPENYTNVYRLWLMLSDRGRDGIRQLKFYDEGVGTRWFDRLTGGAFGAGVSDNIQRGYRWLMEQYDPGDEIFLFGFSRGAFTARSLAGIIARCGLLKPDAPMSFAQVFERYKKGDTVRPIYLLKHLERLGSTEFDFEERALLKSAHYGRNFIKLVGVWDTVGSIGLPFGNWSRRTLRFHNTNLSMIVQNSYQALALDEQRGPYWAILWTSFTPDSPDDTGGSQVDNRMVEQRWFVGAHCDVGGGYRNDLLSQRPLAWLQEKATTCGLSFRVAVTASEEDVNDAPHDSYSDFLGGLWRWLPFGRRYERWVLASPVRKQAGEANATRTQSGTVQTVNERIDHSVFRRCQVHDDYRPPNLLEWASRNGLALEDVIHAPEVYSSVWTPVVTPGLDHSFSFSEPQAGVIG
jgi:uncharacterized protein (DUF2235 family)